MIWQVSGWILLVYLVLQTIYSMFYHQHPYVRMASRARVNPETGVHESRIRDPFTARLANRYLRSVLVMFVMKLAAIAFLLYWLLG